MKESVGSFGYIYVLLSGRHRLTDDDKKHQCTFCPMKFFKRDKLTRHIRTHTGEKRKLKSLSYKSNSLNENGTILFPFFNAYYFFRFSTAFKCSFCLDRAYAQKGDLTKHIKLKHVGHKIYNCEICQEGFQYYADLKTHTFIHYKEDKAKQEVLS